MQRGVILVVSLAACGGGDAELEPLAGAPDATRALAFDTHGDVVAIGGTSTFGLAQLQRFAADHWIKATGVAGFAARAQLLGGGPTVALHAISESTLYRLDDVAAFTWTSFAIPVGASDGTLFGADATGVIYALDLTGGDGNGAVLAWHPGDVRWAEVAGSRPMGVGATGYVVEPSGRVTWAVPGLGIVRAEGGAQTTIVDCNALPSGDCTTPLTALTYDASGDLTFLACPDASAPRAALRLRDAATSVIASAIPTSDVACKGLATAPDGTSILATSDADGATGTLSRWTKTGGKWGRVAAAAPGLTYVPRDSSTVFAFGDARTERGVYRLDL